MQQGFAMLEVGSCAKDHTKEILLKNIMDIAIGAASWWIVGHAIANGDDSFRNSGMNGVFGTSGFGYINAATVGKPGFGGQAEWFFGLSFAATSATIVSGAIAERCNMIPYFLLACLLTSFVYPVVAHVAWHESGRLSAYRAVHKSNCRVSTPSTRRLVRRCGGAVSPRLIRSARPRYRRER